MEHVLTFTGGPKRRRWAVGGQIGLGVAVWWAAQAMAQTGPPDGALLAQAKCASCHGPAGQSATEAFPRLAGQNAKYLVKQLQDFGAGRRINATMKEKVAGLGMAELDAIALYYQAQRPVTSPPKDQALAQVGYFVFDRGNPLSGVPACLACHGTGARGTATLPRLAGQHPAYLVRQLEAFASKHRQNDSAIMSVVAARLTPLETMAVAEYLGGLQ